MINDNESSDGEWSEEESACQETVSDAVRSPDAAIRKKVLERIQAAKRVVGDDLFASPDPAQRTGELARAVLETLAAPFCKNLLVVLDDAIQRMDGAIHTEFVTLAFRAYIVYAWAMAEPLLSSKEVAEAVKGMNLQRWTSYVCARPRHVADEMPYANLLLEIWDMVLRAPPISASRNAALAGLLRRSPAGVIREWLANDTELGPEGVSSGLRRARMLTWISWPRYPNLSLLRGLLDIRAYDLPAVINWAGMTITSRRNGAVAVALDFACQIFSSWNEATGTALRLQHIGQLLSGLVQHARVTDLTTDSDAIYAEPRRLHSVCGLVHVLDSNRLQHFMRISRLFAVLAERTTAARADAPCFDSESLTAIVRIVSCIFMVLTGRLSATPPVEHDAADHLIAYTMDSVISYFQAFFAATLHHRGAQEVMSYPEMANVVVPRISVTALLQSSSFVSLANALGMIYNLVIQRPAEARNQSPASAPATAKAQVACLTKIGTGEQLRGLCTICLEELSPPALMVKACRHVYHVACLDRWLHLTDTCPACRSKIIVND